nr:leukocyte elastase inhibitor B-like [Penaeus vannamei]
MYISRCVAPKSIKDNKVRCQCLSSSDTSPPPRSRFSSSRPPSLDLLQKALPPSGNFFISPFSVWSALVLAYFGSRGKTKAELEQVLRLTNREDTLALFRALEREANQNYTINSANRIYFDQSIPVRECVGKVLDDKVKFTDFNRFKKRNPGTLDVNLLALKMVAEGKIGSRRVSSLDHTITSALIEVDEEGAEAAAATAFVLNRSRSMPPKTTFTCNRPFVFFIQDNEANNILFMGFIGVLEGPLLDLLLCTAESLQRDKVGSHHRERSEMKIVPCLGRYHP